MEKYTEVVAENPEVAFIHLSSDRSEDAAEEWAAEEGFPWLTILPDEVDRTDLVEYRTRNVVPFYTVVDGEGNQLATGSSAVFRKVEELTGDSS